MNPFLKQVAIYLYHHYSREFENLCIVFPNRRAGVFFAAYLNEIIQKPILSPEIITINDLFGSWTDLHQDEQASLIIKLHEVYNKITGYNEPLDEFFFWGEILLSDFDDIDKYMLNANDLFRNISDLKQLESHFDYLDTRQKKAIEEFWGSLNKVPHSLNKDKFIEIWSKLPAIYHQFRQNLKEKQCGYSGMIYRELAEQIKTLSLGQSKYAFIGFNALNECEKTVFNHFLKNEKGIYFWDYNSKYKDDPIHEAGRFIRSNLIQFPQPNDFVLEEVSANNRKKITMVSVPGNISQAQAINIPGIKEGLKNNHLFDDTALVLADENLLVPVVSAAGKSFSSINITMGYPFANTPVYSFISQLLALQKNIRKGKNDEPIFYYKPVLALLNHQFLLSSEVRSFISKIRNENKIYLNSEDLKQIKLNTNIFTFPTDWISLINYLLEIISRLSEHVSEKDKKTDKLDNEYFFQAFLTIQRIKDTLLELGIIDFPIKVLYKILDQNLRRISIPFEGEPLSGLQIMGLLETRCLDFKNLVLFSANEGFLPKTSIGHSFIPFNLRKGFGLPTHEERDAMFAYYFYRLIERPENVTLVYNSVTEGITTSEKSRFLYQLQYDSDYNIEEINLNFDFKGFENDSISIKSSLEHQQKLINKFADQNLSPSAVNTYLDCKLRFYFKYIADLKEEDELKEEVDPMLFGNLFHKAVEFIYKPYEGKSVNPEDLDSILTNKDVIDNAILHAFSSEYFKQKISETSTVKLNGQNILIASYLSNYLIQMIHNDRKIAPFKIISLEDKYNAHFDVMLGEKTYSIQIGGIIDRIDETPEGIRVIDYKTGRNLKLDFTNEEQLFDHQKTDRRKEIFQTLLYSSVINKNGEEKPIFPCIYKIDNLFIDDFNPHILHKGSPVIYQNYAKDFEIMFTELLHEILSEGNSFDQTSDVRKCNYCPYKRICKRNQSSF